MNILGLEDPWIIAAYAGCILTVAFCVYISAKRRNDSDSEDDADD